MNILFGTHILPGHVLFFLEEVFYVFWQHEGSLVKVSCVVPGFDTSLVPSVRIEVLQRMILLAGKSKEPVAGRTGRNVSLINPVNGEYSVGLPVHRSAAFLIFVIERAAMLVNHYSIIMECLVATAVELLCKKTCFMP